MTPAKLLGIPENFAEHGGSVDHMIDVVHYFMIALFVGWTLFFFVAIFRYWRRRSPKASYQGVTSHVSTHTEIGVVIIEAILLLGFAFPLWEERTDRFEDAVEQDAVRVRAIGYQFAWRYHYPGADGKFGRLDPRFIKQPGDTGVDPEDPNGWDDFVSGSVLKVPVDRPAIIQVTSTDVIHNYAIVPMRIQQDAIPGRDIPMWFTPIQKLETYVVCAQLCGEGHANMRGMMEVVSEEAYGKWAAEQSAAAFERNKPQTPGLAQR
ncbi:MAG: cytochrome c oxidase subunit II [Akkermansiaceae bacterium]|nr:cytochrome c oxidase subunit II [Akkermansiaceae bacterium]NNM28785.1 cytochrome c oxidase subunit II [Akkermansiaceae bacterium]